VQAQPSSTDGPSLAAADAQARAQRTADRVKEFILMSSKSGATAASATRPPARPAAHAASAAARAVARPTALRASPSPAAPVPASDAADAVRSAAAAPSTPGSEKPMAVEIVAHAAPDAASLFDFETSTEGFTLHSLAEWTELPAGGLTLTSQAAQGQSALQATSSSDAWLGVDLSQSVDFSALKRVTFWMHSARGLVSRLAIKSGSQFDWCELRPATIGMAGGFVHYEVVLQAKGRECRNLDLEDVRGLHWFVRAGDTVVLDDVELR
jgi:hypothetical protein